MEILNFVVAEKATIEHFSIDGIMDAIAKAFTTVNEPIVLGNSTRFLGKLSMTQYTFEDLGGKMKAQVCDGQSHGMFEVMDLEGDTWDEFLNFRQPYSKRISWEQSAALYWAQKIPDSWVVSVSEHVLDYAKELGIPTMTVEDMQEAFFAGEVSETAMGCQPSYSVAGVFDPLVDADKVAAAFSDRLDGDMSLLKNKSYWAVVCVLFERFEWLKCRKRAEFCHWVNAHFHFDKPLNPDKDIKSAINKMKVKEPNLDLWPHNQYRDLAFKVRELFFGERKGLQNGFYVYANESLYLKPGKMWKRRDW